MSVDQSLPEVLWRPTPQSARATRIARFATWVAERRGSSFGDPPDYDALWRWSVEHLDRFWADVAAWSGVLPGVADDRVLTTLVRSLVDFAHDCGATVVAEGIETAADTSLLRELGVDHGQGWYYGRADEPEALQDRYGVPAYV